MEPTKFDPTSHTLTDDLKAQLKTLVPEAFTEDSIDFDRLKVLLGEMVDGGQERYSFTWPGKTQAIRAAQTPSIGTLVPDKDSSEDWDTTQNLYLEGDNLEILKLLQKSYTGKVKMIYIDPPYNTGKDFVYPDNYGEGLKTYLEYTGQVDGEGKKITTNTETDGRYHSKWLNMMYPRLMLARNLLKEDGVIFISIDDHEQANLKKICDEVFGAENFIDSIIWKKRYGGGAKERYLVSVHEYVLFYAKNKESIDTIEVPLTEESIKRYYTKTDENAELRGPYRTHPLEAGRAMDARNNLIFPITAPDGSEVMPRRQWLWSRERVADALEHGELEFSQVDGQWVVSTKQYLRDRDGDIRKTKAFSLVDDVYTQHGTNETIDLFGDARFFSYPKPVDFCRKLIQMADDPEALIVDFFSGSSSTAHAVMRQNAEDGGNRKFIMSQLQEETPEDNEARKAGYQNIAELGRERIKRAGEKIKTEFAEKLAERETPFDTGFRTYRLSSSTFNTWDVTSADDMQAKLLDATSLIKGDANVEDVLAELVLKSGFGLSEAITMAKVEGVNVYSVANNELMIVLQGTLTETSVRAIADMNPKRFIARENAFPDDASLTSAAQIMKDKGIDFRVL